MKTHVSRGKATHRTDTTPAARPVAGVTVSAGGLVRIPLDQLSEYLDATRQHISSSAWLERAGDRDGRADLYVALRPGRQALLWCGHVVEALITDPETGVACCALCAEAAEEADLYGGDAPAPCAEVGAQTSGREA